MDLQACLQGGKLDKIIKEDGLPEVKNLSTLGKKNFDKRNRKNSGEMLLIDSILE